MNFLVNNVLLSLTDYTYDGDISSSIQSSTTHLVTSTDADKQVDVYIKPVSNTG